MDNFDGQTWVAYSDLCGLKAMYEQDSEVAAKALDKFYNTVYELREGHEKISALVVSDCAIFWIDRNGNNVTEEGLRIEPETLVQLLTLLKNLHYTMILADYLVRTTIAYGHFRYQNRLEMPRIRKDMIIGGAYLDAYANNNQIELGSIVVTKLPENTKYASLSIDSHYKKMIKANSPQRNYYEYFWLLQKQSCINSFINKRKEIHNKVFQEMKQLYSPSRDNI